MPNTTNPSRVEVVTVAYNDLVSACNGIDNPSPNTASNINVNELIEKAFGSTSPNSLGIIAVTDVPSLPSLRFKLLPMAQQLATLSSKQLDEITSPEAGYQVGWSHGREKLEGDKLDFSKGSFYANPLTDDLAESMLDRRRYLSDRQNNNESVLNEDMDNVLKWDESIESIKTDEELQKLAEENPAFFAPNIWPTKSMPSLESTFKDVGRLVHQVGTLVAKCCDSYVASRCTGYTANKLEDTLRYSKCCKARLLHYFASDDNIEATNENAKDNDDTEFSNWCGWHNDHGSLTGLLPALYLDPNGQVVDCLDPQAGLEKQCKFRVGAACKQHHMLSTFQYFLLAVRCCKIGNVSRETFAVFMEPEYHSNMDLPKGRTVEDTQCEDAERWLPRTVKTLRSRWRPGMNFGEFSNETFAAFH
eukprot:scaffold567_cov230-Alexandrium_tamarense.AAC.8